MSIGSSKSFLKDWFGGALYLVCSHLETTAGPAGHFVAAAGLSRNRDGHHVRGAGAGWPMNVASPLNDERKNR